TMGLYSARMLTSAAAAAAVPPAAVISATTVPARSGMWLWLTTTLAPAAARVPAMALPIPVAAPVTSAVLPASDVVLAGAAAGLVIRTSSPGAPGRLHRGWRGTLPRRAGRRAPRCPTRGSQTSRR